MVTRKWFRLLEISIVFGLLPCLPGTAQIIPDTTLPNVSTVETQGNTILIEAGTKANSNLFHSFDKFSIPTGTTAFFNNVSDIQNIITRVTGSGVSQINGTLKANGTANLFLLNPNGIIFGANAQLALGGSFLATTANAVNFIDQTEFSATTPQTSLLSVNVPLGLQYGSNPGSIEVQGASLQMPANSHLSLVGGNISLNGGKLLVPGGRVELAAVGNSGTINLQVNGNRLSLNIPNTLQLADISLVQGAEVNVRAGGGGSIAINAQNLNILGASQLLAGIGSAVSSNATVPGDIDINATKAINLTADSAIANSLVTSATQVNVINTPNTSNILNISQELPPINQAIPVELPSVNEAMVIEVPPVIVEVPPIIVEVPPRPSPVGHGNNPDNPGENSGNGNIPSGNTGNINITAESLSITNGAQLSTTTSGQGNAGNININVRDTVSFDRRGAAFSSVNPQAVGNGGMININAGSVFVTNGGRLNLATWGQGNAGSVNINARHKVLFDGVDNNGFFSAIFSTVESTATGNGGGINITANSLDVSNGGEIQSLTNGNGNAGNISIKVADAVNLSGVAPQGFSSGLFSGTGETGGRQGGDINVAAGVLRLKDGAVLSTRTFRDFSGGNIIVDVNQLDISSGGQLLASTFGSGSAGNITVNAASAINISGSDPTYINRLEQFGRVVVDPTSSSSGLFANTGNNSTGAGGSMNLSTAKFTISDHAGISVNSSGQGNAGNLNVLTTDSLNLNNHASISAGTTSGEGGNIALQINNFSLMRGNSSISTNAGGIGNGGNITINSPFVVALPTDNSDLTANAVKGRGGNIDIHTTSIYGLQFRNQLSAGSDITASSEFGVNGVVEISTPGVDVSRGLTNLPDNVVNVESLIQRSCSSDEDSTQGQFVITGKGGLPSNPSETLGGMTVLADLGSSKLPTANSTPSSTVSAYQIPIAKPADRLVEAQSWVKNHKGEVVLLANATQVTAHNSWLSPAGCHQN